MAKYTTMCYHYARDQIEQRKYLVFRIPSGDQLADFLAKPASKEIFMRCRSPAGLC
ncbi:hypothetical protein BDV93DRAFT_517978 [Ceratobasidium sp. AG-I]|nr:hypothetical protein BDV93DRAFT_517978 [Ceratobasidium sp. AG-I]